MLLKSHRLPRLDFLRVKSTGHSSRTPLLTVLSLPNSLTWNRYSIVTSAKLSKRAVDRNRLRRQIFDTIKDLPGSSDYILFPTKQVLTTPLTQHEIALFKSN